jgi:AcrR family transcriptional regulator
VSFGCGVGFVVGLVYHDGMTVPRQGDPAERGRVHQKRRTRNAIVAAAEELLAAGVTPTVARAAAAAEVSRTTAYRYFPTQEALLVEVAVTDDVAAIEALVAEGTDADGAVAHTLLVLDRLNRHVAEAEVQYRAALRLYLDQWLRQAEAGDTATEVREGRRVRWFERCLDPLRDQVTPEDWERVVTGLSLLCGAEALAVLRDVRHLDDEQGRAHLRWAAEQLLRATFPDARAVPS